MSMTKEAGKAHQSSATIICRKVYDKFIVNNIK